VSYFDLKKTCLRKENILATFAAVKEKKILTPGVDLVKNILN
jgi:hypothetical protein